MENNDQIWEQYSKQGNLPLINEKPYLQIPLNKKNSKKQSAKYVAFYNSEIRYFKDKGYTQCKGILKFSFDITVEWLYLGKVDGNQSKLPPLMGFKLSKFQNSISFYTRSEGNLCMIQNFLKGKTNQLNIHYYYRAIKKLGKGNFAIVYLLENKQNGKQFAAKFFSKQNHYEKPSGKESIANEINILRQLQHPNILKLHEVFETENSIYMVMDLLQGGHLREKIRQKKILTESETAYLISSLLHSAHNMYQHKIMHRDIKPENLMYQDIDQSKIILVDFGLATFWDEEVYMFPRCGTPGFVAPEIANNKDPNAHYTGICDLFSIGCVMHIALTGKPLFKGQTHLEVLNSNKICQLDFSDSMYQKISSQAMNLMKQLLEKDPQQRITASNALGHPFIMTHTCSENIDNDEAGDDDDDNQKLSSMKKYTNNAIKNPFSDKQSYLKTNQIEECNEQLEETPTFQTKKLDKKNIPNKNLQQFLSSPKKKQDDSFAIMPQHGFHFINSQINHPKQNQNSQNSYEELDQYEQQGSEQSASINQEGLQLQMQQMNEVSQLASGFQPPQKLSTSPMILLKQQSQLSPTKGKQIIQEQKNFNQQKPVFKSQFSQLGNSNTNNSNEFAPPQKISTSPHIQLKTKIEPLSNLQKK